MTVAEATAAAIISSYVAIVPGSPAGRREYRATYEGPFGGAAMGYGDTPDAARTNLASVLEFNLAHNGVLVP